MLRSRSIAALCALSVLVGVTSSHAAPISGDKPTAPAGRKVSNGKALGRAQFESLRDDDVVDVGDKPMTKREVLAKAKALREAAAAREAAEEHAAEQAREAFAKKEKEKTDAANAPVLAKMTELKAAAPRTLVVMPVGTSAVQAKPAPAAPSGATPEIKGMLGQIKPGNAVILFGSSFGSLEGEVRMYGTFPNGFVKLSIDSWGPGGIGVFVPPVTGVLDQQVTLKVVTKAGQYSNYKTAPFTATREVKKLSMSDLSKKDCRDAALTIDQCKTVGQDSCTSTVCGYHMAPELNMVGESTDRFAATLKNGWEYESHTWKGESAFLPSPAEWFNPILLIEAAALSNNPPTLNVVSKGTTPSFEIPWQVFNLWTDRYKLNVYVTGPAGTSPI